jgi:hypothetical protein
LTTRKQLPPWLLLAGLTIAALLVHGYHFGIEDGAIYVPGILKLLDPSLFPHDSHFFTSQTRSALFAPLVALLVRITAAPLQYVDLALYLLVLFVFLAGCYAVARVCFAAEHERWFGVAMVAALLTLPVAGTAIYIADQHLHPRVPATAALLFAIAAALERRWVVTIALVIVAAAFHPQMAFYGAGFLLVLAWPDSWRRTARPAFFIGPLSLFSQPMTEAWQAALRSRTSHYLLQWRWYEWLGAIGPSVLLFLFARILPAERAQRLCRRAAVYGFLVLAAGLVVTVPEVFEPFTPFQPMRGLHLIYIVLVLISGGLLARWTGRIPWRWAVILLPLAGVMFFAQRQLFSQSDHLDLPWRTPRNPYVQAFLWAREHSGPSTLFALDPYYKAHSDYYGFRAWAQRSMLADDKDLGVSGLFPENAQQAYLQIRVRSLWTKADFAVLRDVYGVSMVILERDHPAQLACPYQNERVRVCSLQ